MPFFCLLWKIYLLYINLVIMNFVDLGFAMIFLHSGSLALRKIALGRANGILFGVSFLFLAIFSPGRFWSESAGGYHLSGRHGSRLDFPRFGCPDQWRYGRRSRRPRLAGADTETRCLQHDRFRLPQYVRDPQFRALTSRFNIKPGAGRRRRAQTESRSTFSKAATPASGAFGGSLGYAQEKNTGAWSRRPE